jgi:hypothetical protein
MRTFGSFRPQALQAAVRHAERLVGLLAREEARGGGDDLAGAWLTGRAGEVERFVEALVEDWRRGRRTSPAAAAALADYLHALHEGMRQHLRIQAPECCADATVPTAAARPGKPGAGGVADLEATPSLSGMNGPARQQPKGC